jgi:hypothetical protein
LGAIFSKSNEVRTGADRSREYSAPIMPFNGLPNTPWNRGGHLLRFVVVLPAAAAITAGPSRSAAACPMSAAFTAIAERLREKTDFFKRIKLFLPVQSHLQKYFASPVGQIISTNSRHPTPPQGRIAIVTDAGCGCGGRGSVLRATDRRAGR